MMIPRADAAAVASTDFAQDEFDVQSFVSTLSAGGGGGVPEEVSEQLRHRLGEVEGQINTQVQDHYEDLISHATGIKRVEEVLNMMQTKSTALSLSIGRVRAKMDDNYEKAQQKVTQLENMQDACDSLRRVIRVLFIGKRLYQQLQAGERDLPKAAQSVSQLEQLLQYEDLHQIEVVQPVIQLHREANKSITHNNAEILQRSLTEENQNLLGNALQVYFHLGQLPWSVRHMLDQLKSQLRNDVTKLLSVTHLNKSADRSGGFGPGKANMPITGNSAALRTNFWTSVEKIVGLSVAAVHRLHFILSVLKKKKDTVTQDSFFDTLVSSDDSSCVSLVEFVKFVQSALKVEFGNCAGSSHSLKQIIDSEYPKLLKQFLSLRDKVKPYLEPSANDSFNENENIESSEEINEGWKNCLADFQSAYLSRSLSRLFDPVNLGFTKDKIPTEEEVVSIIGIMESEMGVAQFDEGLSHHIAKNVSKTVELLAIKCEECIPGADSPETWQVLATVNPTQLFMLSVVNLVHDLRTRLLSSFHPYIAQGGGAEVLKGSLRKLEDVMENSVGAWMGNVERCMKDILGTLHSENYSLQVLADSRRTSLYIRELETFTSRVQQSYLSQFHCADVIDGVTSRLAAAVGQFFIIQISLIKGISDAGYSLIDNDLSAFEAAVKQLNPHAMFNFKNIRFLGTLLRLDSQDFGSCDQIGDLIPYSVAICVLFSRAYPGITPPYMAAEMDESDFSNWLQRHPAEKDRIQFLNSGLESYVQRVRNEGGREYSPLYPHLLHMLEKASKHIDS